MTQQKPFDGQLVPAESRILRLPKPPPDFVPDGWRPGWQLFAPSSGDKESAQRRHKPVRVSVWDEGLTSAEQAQAFRQVPTLVLRLSVQDVLDVAVSFGRPLRVVYEPLDPPADTKPGADGHAGIEGLEKAGQPTATWQALLDELARHAELMTWPA
jgi:hypothetical protein